MQLVEQHILTRNDSRFEAVDRAAFAAKNLYNAANYLVRQSFINENHYLNYYDVHAQMKGHEAYQALPRKVSQQVLRMLDQNWQGFFAALKAYRAAPSKFRKRPGLPRYLDKTEGRYVLVYTVQALSKPALKRSVIVPSGLAIEVRTKQTRIAQVRIVPKGQFLDDEPIQHHAWYADKRITRGLFRASDGRLINADVNGAYNIIRKAIPNAFGNGKAGVVVHPVGTAPAN
jgi:putative transposase